jgi:hypothetical protein
MSEHRIYSTPLCSINLAYVDELAKGKSMDKVLRG